MKRYEIDAELLTLNKFVIIAKTEKEAEQYIKDLNFNHQHIREQSLNDITIISINEVWDEKIREYIRVQATQLQGLYKA